MNKEALPKKPLPREACAIAARAAVKQARREGKPALCESCVVPKYTICPNTGHAICSKRKDTGWIPVPFSIIACGLYAKKEEVLVHA